LIGGCSINGRLLGYTTESSSNHCGVVEARRPNAADWLVRWEKQFFPRGSFR
jgi:hypothetical protein